MSTVTTQFVSEEPSCPFCKVGAIFTVTSHCERHLTHTVNVVTARCTTCKQAVQRLDHRQTINFPPLNLRSRLMGLMARLALIPETSPAKPTTTTATPPLIM